VLKHGPDLYTAFLGAMLAGCIPTFMPFPSAKQDPEHYWSSHRTLFERLETAAILTYADNVAPLNAHCPGIAVMTPADAATIVDAPPIERRPRADEIAFLQHSSGTTGLKKGVLLSFGSVAEQLARYAPQLGIAEGDTIVSWLPLYHDMGLIACFMLPATVGAPIIALDPFEWVAQPDQLLRALDGVDGAFVWLPNFAFHHLVRAVRPEFAADLSGVRAFVDCSEPCRLETFELFERTFARLGVRWDQFRVCYAMAEMVFAITQTPPGERVRALDIDERALAEGLAEPAGSGPSRSVMSVGTPLADTEVKIVGDGGETSVGEVAVRAPFLFSGYHLNAELTADKIKDGWYHTGDLGFRRDGELYILGRTDDLLILNGRNVFAHHVEFTINAEAPQIKAGRCIALGVYNPQVGSQELVIVAEVDGEGIDLKGLQRIVKSVVLDAYGVMPREVMIAPPGWLAKSTSGKIARGRNLDKYLAGRQAALTATGVSA
jgi:fatty-acyl-CoA synthase